MELLSHFLRRLLRLRQSHVFRNGLVSSSIPFSLLLIDLRQDRRQPQRQGRNENYD